MKKKNVFQGLLLLRSSDHTINMTWHGDKETIVIKLGCDMNSKLSRRPKRISHVFLRNAIDYLYSIFLYIVANMQCIGIFLFSGNSFLFRSRFSEGTIFFVPLSFSNISCVLRHKLTTCIRYSSI